ncbi:MAG TPA: hypothetical protein VN908_06505 [Gemmatimonadales bacterium]|nr:hypothetical protein [Gemmatimonadales bacterium]
MTEAEVILAAGDYLRTRGTPVTPAKVESFVRERLAQNGQVLPGAAVKEIVTAVNALVHNTQRKDTTMGKEQEFAGVTREGKNAGVIKTERLEQAQQFAPSQPVRPYEVPPLSDRLGPQSGYRLSDAKRQELEAQAGSLRLLIAAPGISPTMKIRYEQDLAKIERLLELDVQSRQQG